MVANNNLPKCQDEESTRAERRSSVSDSSSRSSCEKSSQLPPSQVSKDPSSGKEDGTIHTLNMIVRTRTDSGKPLTDLVIDFFLFAKTFS